MKILIAAQYLLV